MSESKTPVSKLSDAGRVLFGEDKHPAIIRAYSILSPELTQGESPRMRFRQVLEDSEIASSASDHKVYSLVVEATFASYRWISHDLLDELITYYREDEKRIPTHPMGMSLGIFRAVKLVERNIVWTNNNMIPLVCKVLAILALAGKGLDIRVSSCKEQKGVLSAAVADFLRPVNNNIFQTDNLGCRLAHLSNMVVTVDEKLSTQGTTLLGQFGEVFMDDVCYLLFGRMSTLGRIKAMTQFHLHLTEPKP